MDYHKIGEKFEYEGVMLEVMDGDELLDTCTFCYFEKLKCGTLNCCSDERYDGKDAYFKLVEQCKTKDMEQKTEIKIEGTDKTFATQVTNIQSDEEIYGSLLDKLFTTYKAKDADYGSAFAEMYDELGIDYAYGKLREKMNRIKVCAVSLIWSRTRDWKMPCSIPQDMRYLHL